MRVDKELVEQMVVQIMKQLAGAQDVQNVFILGSKNEAASITLPQQEDVTTKVYCNDDPCDVTEINRYVLPMLELEDMADLALGKATSVKARQILPLLLAGKTVEVYQYAYTGYEDSAPSQLYGVYCDYAETLSGFGLCPLQKQVQKTTRINARVISEKDIQKCSTQGVTRIAVSGKAIVTSLAKECAKKFGIEIQRG